MRNLSKQPLITDTDKDLVKVTAYTYMEWELGQMDGQMDILPNTFPPGNVVL